MIEVGAPDEQLLDVDHTCNMTIYMLNNHMTTATSHDLSTTESLK